MQIFGGANEGIDAIAEDAGNSRIDIAQEIDTSNLTQMEIDAINIKSQISMIKPLEGTITSRYGYRNPTTNSVPKNHTGLDIAANTGTNILSAMDGTVILVSSEGDYGNHIKILNGDIITVYAHCNEVYVVEEQVVKQGEVIASVGATGNTTGPHLHFEIRKQDRMVDPELVLGNM